MADLIDRQAAIDATSEIVFVEYEDGDPRKEESIILQTKAAIRDRIKALPPVQPKRGHWILDRSGAYCCSECMEPCSSYVMMKPRDKFCKMCGARMEM